MEKQLFSWEGWDGDLECMIFYNVVLKTRIGDYEVGTKFSSASLSYLDGYLELYDDFEGEKPPVKFHLNIVVGNKFN